MTELERLQSEADKYGWHKKLKAWVDDKSEIARYLRSLDQ